MSSPSALICSGVTAARSLSMVAVCTHITHLRQRCCGAPGGLLPGTQNEHDGVTFGEHEQPVVGVCADAGWLSGAKPRPCRAAHVCLGTGNNRSTPDRRGQVVLGHG